ncbi:hypothetical protein [Xenorhabdus koppenhoeferi]|uniref:Uncharacterized protein n=1 Tax=Xenorhabdus koppenhoeferi TaxID=351659 RepID=A0A1I7K7M2_9GAMM|nr:hypothetical protein [Xenorhabdus koppenhoeferi]SFU93420.1 hypothetical protein SAMN05421784_1491 [Xenorhabdus koppenhoeferi]
MEIRIIEDGSAEVVTAEYLVRYDKDGRLNVSMGGQAPATLVIHNAFKQKADKEQVGITSDTFKLGFTY